jgi:hypothetical protein
MQYESFPSHLFTDFDSGFAVWLAGLPACGAAENRLFRHFSACAAVCRFF